MYFRIITFYIGTKSRKWLWALKKLKINMTQSGLSGPILVSSHLGQHIHHFELRN